MITAFLQGGMGNQMFQMAAAISLAKDMGVDYKFDFDICHTPAQGNTSNKYRDNIFTNINNGPLNQSDFKKYMQSKFSYDELPKVDNLMIRGDFQSEKYFIKYKDFIKRFLFVFSVEKMDKADDCLDELDYDKDFTAVHVRRGDYLNKPNFHPVCTVEYYKEAMDMIGGNFIFVSDDIEWCKENFKGDNIFYSPFTNELDDLYLIMACQNQIIANSSFSWWGAYLCQWEGNKVIAPSIWFGPQGPQDTQDIIPSDWIKI